MLGSKKRNVCFIVLVLRIGGYKSYEHYLAVNNPVATAEFVDKVPGLVINSADDPLCTKANLDEWRGHIFEDDEACPYGILLETQYGSHCCFFDLFGNNWVDHIIGEYLLSLRKLKGKE